MSAQDKSRAAELAEALAYQEVLLNIGTDRLKELNTQYDTLDREYKLLLLQKGNLVEEIIILTENLDLYSNL